MVYLIRKILATVSFIISILATSSLAYADDVITFAEADTITGESLINLIAFERAKARGVNAEAISLQSDDLVFQAVLNGQVEICLLYTSPSPRDRLKSRMPSSA